MQDGRLYHSDVGEIWKRYPKTLHDWLLRLTEVFDLTFPLPNDPSLALSRYYFQALTLQSGSGSACLTNGSMAFIEP